MNDVWGGGTAREGIPETAGTADEQPRGKQTSGAFTVGKAGEGGKAGTAGQDTCRPIGTCGRREPIRRVSVVLVVLVV